MPKNIMVYHQLIITLLLFSNLHVSPKHQYQRNVTSTQLVQPGNLIGKWKFNGNAEDVNQNKRPDAEEIAIAVNEYNKIKLAAKEIRSMLHFTDDSHCNYIVGDNEIKWRYTYALTGNNITLKHINERQLEDQILTLSGSGKYILFPSPLNDSPASDMMVWSVYIK